MVTPNLCLKHDRKLFYFSTIPQPIYKPCYTLTLSKADENPPVLINFPDVSHANSQHGPWNSSLQNKSIMKNMGFEVKQTYIQITVQSLAGCVFRPVTNLLEFVPLAARWDLFDHQKRYSSSAEVLGTKWTVTTNLLISTGRGWPN